MQLILLAFLINKCNILSKLHFEKNIFILMALQKYLQSNYNIYKMNS